MSPRRQTIRHWTGLSQTPCKNSIRMPGVGIIHGTEFERQCLSTICSHSSPLLWVHSRNGNVCPRLSNCTNLVPRREEGPGGEGKLRSLILTVDTLSGTSFPISKVLLQMNLPQLFHHQESLLLFLLHGPHVLNDSAATL